MNREDRMRNAVRIAVALLLALATSGVAAAQTVVYDDEKSLWDYKARGSAAIGANYETNSALGDEAAPPYKKEFSLGGYGAYNLVPKLSMVGSVVYGFDNNYWRSSLGANHQFFDGEIDLGIGLTYEWVSADDDAPVPQPSKEFVTSLRGVYPVNPWLLAAGSAAYGLDSKVVRYSIGLRVVVFN